MAPKTAAKSNKRIFKLYVKEYVRGKGRSSVDALQYILQNIDFLNTYQIHVKIIKIKEAEMDKDMVSKLKSLGVTNFPALIPDVGRTRLGVAQIKELVEINKTKVNDQMRKQEELTHREHEANFSDNPDLAKLWAGEMNFKSFKNDNGEESAFDGGANEDYGRKVAELMRSRGGNTQRPDQLDEAPRRRRTDMNTAPEPRAQNGRGEQRINPRNDPRGDTRTDHGRTDNMPDERQMRRQNVAQEVPVITKNQPMTDDMVERRFMENSMISDY